MPILQLNEVVREDYRVERLLGEGAFAEVYRVEHRFWRSRDRRMAMKVFKTPFHSPEELESLLREAQLLAVLDHPNIIRVKDLGLIERGGAKYGWFSMEYLSDSLHDLWLRYKSEFMPIAEAVQIVAQVCRGLAVAHEKNPPIIHRDVKPQNILIGYDGEALVAKVGDFGLARQVNPLTLLASARGTLSFKPPEALENQDSVASDIWAIGTTLYLCLTDRLPYPELSERGVADARAYLKPLRPPSFFNISAGSRLDVIVLRCLAAEPQDRYARIADLAADLERWRPRDPAEAGSPITPSDPLAGSAWKAEAAMHRPPGGSTGRTPDEMVREALRLSKKGQLDRAAEILEAALVRKPELRTRYGPRLQAWLRGVAM